MALGQVFLRVLRFPPSISFHRGYPFSYHLEDEQKARCWPQSRDTFSHIHKNVLDIIILTIIQNLHDLPVDTLHPPDNRPPQWPALNLLVDHVICDLFLMSTGWDYISELRPTTGTLFILQMMYEYADPWWIDTGRGIRKSSEKNLSQCRSGTTNSERTDKASNPSLRCEQYLT
jgi:hypothetical protein